MSKRMIGVTGLLTLALCCAHPALAQRTAPGSVEPTAPAAPPAAAAPAAPATTAPATTAPATTAPPAAATPEQSTESAKPKSDAKQRRRVSRHRYRYAYRDPFYYWHPRFWLPFRPYRYRAYRYPRRYAYHRYHRRHYRAPFFFR
jgi:hypothetical protein